ncbi:hypothetical protein NDU88_004868 [Pleurodeles waltl]|uniref:Uncharacterized protein n=1 Tax=Pleurodeles waltl TaxID=8319 RepID=A0AAV7TUY9_PLEWA|nr:hypothetical protein NDU88_004868 [Pleurodeles waltl]
MSAPEVEGPLALSLNAQSLEVGFEVLYPHLPPSGLCRGGSVDGERLQGRDVDLCGPPAAELRLLQGAARGALVGGLSRASPGELLNGVELLHARGKAPGDRCTDPQQCCTRGHQRYLEQVCPPSSPVGGWRR